VTGKTEINEKGKVKNEKGCGEEDCGETVGRDHRARRMRDSGVEWIGAVPEGWKVLPLKYLIREYKAGPFGSALITGELMPTGEILV